MTQIYNAVERYGRRIMNANQTLDPRGHLALGGPHA